MKTLLLLAVVGSAAHAQQQTEASGGIPVPPPPASATSPTVPESVPETHSFRIRLLDGRNGAPIAGGHVRLWYDEPVGEGYIVATDAHGIALMPAPAGQPVRILVRSEDGTDCRHEQRYAPKPGYSLAELANSGKAAENTCGGGITVHTTPGELVLFVRPARWYEKLNRPPEGNAP